MSTGLRKESRCNRLWRRWKNTIAYLALTSALFVALARGEDARHQIARSGTAATTIGCNRDFRTNQGLRAILVRGSGSLKRQYEAGILDAQDYRIGKAYYIEQINTIVLPDCRDLKIVQSGRVRIPIALYPGSPYEDRARPGENFQPLPKSP